MALDVEDGSAKSTAEAYITVSDADTYFADRGNAAWAGQNTAAKEQALRKGADYMMRKYRRRWKGMRVTAAQALCWPRAGVQTEDFHEPERGPRPSAYSGLAYLVPEDSIPVEIRRANAELAVRSLEGDLAPDLDRGGRIASETVGPLHVAYEPGAEPGKRFDAVEMLLAPFLRDDPLSAQVIRS